MGRELQAEHERNSRIWTMESCWMDKRAEDPREQTAFIHMESRRGKRLDENYFTHTNSRKQRIRADTVKRDPI